MSLERNMKVAETAHELPKEIRQPIVKLIDFKTNEDMKEVIAEIKGLRSDMDNKFNAMDSKFTAMDAKFTAMDGKFASLDWRLKILYWVIGVIAIPTLLLAIANFITK